MDSTLPTDIDTRPIPLDLIDASPTNPRKTFDEAKLAELATSMASPVGQIHPALVRPVGERFELVAGERRWRAARLAGLAHLRCEVREIPDDLVREMQLVENAGREDVHPLEEAIALAGLEDVHPLEEAIALAGLVAVGRTAEYLADRLGHSVRWVQRRLALLGLTETAREWLRDGRLPIAHAQQLAAVDAATQGRVLGFYDGRSTGGLPSSRDFAQQLAYELHGLDAAPFGVADAKLPGHGVCAKCPHRSDTQGDLFAGAPTHAMCLDAACWDGKVAAVWERAVKSAPKKHLTVIAEPATVFGYADNLRWDSEFQKTPGSAGAKPVALARTANGHIVELYAKPKAAPAGGAEDDSDGENEGEDGEGAAPAQRGLDRWELQRQERIAAGEKRLARLCAIVDHAPGGAAIVLRNALRFEVDNPSADSLRTVLRLRGAAWADGLSDDALVDGLPAEDLAQTLGILMANDQLQAIESAPAPDERPAFEAELLELMKGEAPAAPEPLAVEAAPPVRLWLPARPFGKLTDYGRASYDHPDVVADLAWETRGGWVTAEMPEGVARIVRDLALDDGFALHEGPDAPPDTTTELRVKRSAWQQHRSGLRDCATGPLHKQWLPDGDDRVARVARGAAVVAQVVEYSRAHKVPLFVNGAALAEPEAAAPAAKAKRAKAVSP
jgi:ParB/RepB/Spo0J family partition protein